jgi:cell division protein FtsB
MVRLLWRRLAIIALLFLVAASIVGVWDVYHKEEESQVLRDQAESQYTTLAQQETLLQSNIANLQTERGKEAALRQQYAVGKKGEGLIVIVDPTPPAPVQASSTIMQWVQKFLPFW